MSLLTHPAEVPDFRRQHKNVRHNPLDMLVISVLAVLSGADDFEEIAGFGQQKAAVFQPCPVAFPPTTPSGGSFRA